MNHPVNWSTTEADAAAYERRFGPDYPDLDDRPDPSDLEPEWDGCRYCQRKSCADGSVCGGEFDLEPDDLGEVNLGAITAVFLTCLIGTCLFFLAVDGGRAGMCHLYRGRPVAPSYCAAAATR